MQPPPIVEKFQYHTLKQINLEGKRVYQTPSGDKVPSVTTILSKTKDMTAINEWKQRVGETEAKRIVTEASGVGSAMHANLERYLIGEQRVPGSNLVHLQANKMADQIINQAKKIADIDVGNFNKWRSQRAIKSWGKTIGNTAIARGIDYGVGIPVGLPLIYGYRGAKVFPSVFKTKKATSAATKAPKPTDPTTPGCYRSR